MAEFIPPVLKNSDSPERRASILERQAAYADAARLLLAELRDIGYDLASVQELRSLGKGAAAAVPVLARWLPRVRYLLLKEDIARTLAFDWAREASTVLLAEFARPTYDLYEVGKKSVDPDGAIRACIGIALGQVLDDNLFEKVEPLILDRDFGTARAPLLIGLGRVEKHKGEAVALLEKFLDDPDPGMVQSALRGLWELEAWESANRVRPVLERPESWLRAEARRWLQRAEKT